MSRLLRFVAAAAALVLLTGTGCKKKNSAPEPPGIQGPTSAKPADTLTYRFTSTDPDGDSVFYMISWRDGDSTQWSPARPSDTEYIQTYTYPDSGVYYIKAKAKDTKDAESEWSDPRQVKVGFLPPETPSRPAGPTSCSTRVAYTFKTKAVHPQHDSVSIQFFWGDFVGNWGPMVASNEYYEESRIFWAPGEYRIAARARDTRGLESEWSDSLTVTVLDTLQGPPSGAPHDLVLTAATDSTVNIAWAIDSTPSRYVVLFQWTGTTGYDSVGGTQSLGLIHDPVHRTGQYRVTAVYDGGRDTSTEAPSTAPIANSLQSVPELNGTGYTGYGWDRTTGEADLYDMTVRDSAKKVDFYVTDFAQGFAGPDYFAASPDTAQYDPGVIVPLDGLYETRFTHLDSLADEDSILPYYLQSRYRQSSILDSLSVRPRLVACRTWDAHFALLKVTDVDTILGTADIETWFQLIPDLRLIEHF